MTARAKRLAGAILLETADGSYLIGNTKEPCDWTSAGFAAPTGIDALQQPWIRLQGRSTDMKPALVFAADVADGPTLAGTLVSRFMIRRNGSVSERLWRIATGQQNETEPVESTDATWLIVMPERVWDVVRDAVLRCV
jgi:hypothetical protein